MLPLNARSVFSKICIKCAGKIFKLSFFRQYTLKSYIARLSFHKIIFNTQKWQLFESKKSFVFKMLLKKYVEDKLMKIP